MRTRQYLCFMTVLVMLCAICLSDAPAKAEAMPVQAAPMTYNSSSRNGMVRVYLSSMGNPANLTVTVAGSYMAQGSQQVKLSRGQTVRFSMNASSGAITMTVGGKAYGMGKDMTLMRRQTEGENGLRIAQARVPGNLYPGDLRLVAVKGSSGYAMHPILHVFMETYLEGVVPYEMGGSAPLESLKAQAVAARTYTLGKMAARAYGRYDVVDTTNDQVYSGSAGNARSNDAIRATQGVALMYQDKLTETFYTASNGGQTESAANLWGSKGYEYLTVQDDPFDLLNAAAPVKSFTIPKDLTAQITGAVVKKLLRAKAVS